MLVRDFSEYSLQNDDHKLKIDGYNLMRPDHPIASKKRWSLYIYYKEHITLIRRDNLWTLDNCLATEIRSKNEKCFLTCAYGSPSQSQEEFEIFCTKFDMLFSQINDEFPLHFK